MDAPLGYAHFAELARTAKLIHYLNLDGYPIRVYDHPEYRWLQFSQDDIQSAMKKSQPWQLVLPYMPALMTALLFAPALKRIAIAGLGGGELVRFINHLSPQSEITAIESNANVIDVFNQFFRQHDSQVTIVNAKIEEAVSIPSLVNIDLLIVDIFVPESLPTVLLKASFYHLIRSKLTSDGLFVANIVVENESQAIAILHCIKSVFDDEMIFASLENEMNVIVIAANNNLERNIKVLSTRANSLAIDALIDAPSWLDKFVQTNQHVFTCR